MSRHFICWNPDAEGDPGTDAPHRHRATGVLSVEGAAEQYAELIHSDSDCPEEMTIKVRDPDGQVHTVKVSVAYEPSFSAEVQS